MANQAEKDEPPYSSNSANENDERNCHRKNTRRGLMTKLGKHDLLRLLSILEGELEARDIYITNLQARINRDNHAKERYFQHAISDPFLALMRDNEAVNGSVTPNQQNSASKTLKKDAVHIQPLPLLEKVVGECKKQQVKVKQHTALSDAYYKLVNKELLDVKRRYAKDTATGDDITVALEKEREKLQIEIRAERAKSRKVEFEYKNLLQTINRERQRFQIISTMLLEERQVRKSDIAINDDVSAEQLKEQFKELSVQNYDLKTLVHNLRDKEVSMKAEIECLKQQLKDASQLAQTANVSNESHNIEKKSHSTVASSCFKGIAWAEENHESHSLKNRNESKPASLGKPTPRVSATPAAAKVDQRSTIVSVKRTSSIIEKRCLKLGEKLSSRALPLSKSVDSATFDEVKNRNSYKSQRNNERTLKVSSIVSSPTSGAANFALNSPNQPPPNNSFPSTLSKAPSSASGSFQATRQHFQRYAKAKPSPPVSQKANVKENNPATAAQSRSANSGEISSTNALPSVQAKNKADSKNSTIKKSPENSNVYKPQPPKPGKNGAKPHKEETSDTPRQASVPPVPPKKPNLPSKPIGGKTGTGRTSRDVDSIKNSGAQANDKTSRISSRPSPNAMSKLPNPQSTTKTSIRRPTSLHTNHNNNNNNSNSIRLPNRFSNLGDGNEVDSLKVHPVPPSSAPARMSLSAQQRLFPPQDGSDGQLLSPITNTVPKSPLGSAIFKF